jgi:hypothetical protein
MQRRILAALGLAGLAACSVGKGKIMLTDSAGGRVELWPSDSARSRTDLPVNFAPASRTLAAGSRIAATWGSAISSRSNRVGEIMTVSVVTDVKDARGRVVIPAASTVELRITQLAPATNRGQADGRLALTVASATIRGRRYPIHGDVTSVDHTREGRGIGKAEAMKVGVGTAIGAVAGQVIGKDTKGTVIGAAVGTVGGAAVAAQTARRDVVVSPGAAVAITLTGPLTVWMK